MLTLADVPTVYPRERIALVHEGLRWTFGRLDQESAAWARYLNEQGVGLDQLVAYSLPNGPDFIALTFGIYRAGATPAPISHKLPKVEQTAILETMQPAMFIDDVVGQEKVPPPAPFPISVPFPTAASWKACTSGGSTGRPKVIVDKRPAEFAMGTDFIGIPSEGVVLVPGPLYHNAPFSAAVFALWRGCTVVTTDRFDAATSLSLIEAEKVNWSLMVPTMLHRIWRLPEKKRDKFDLSTWEMVVHTAAPMPKWLKREWIGWQGPDHIWEVYGATEGLVRCWIGGREWLERPGSVGKPIGGARLRILDEDGVILPSGEEGEIYAMPPNGPQSSYSYIGAERRATSDGWESVGDIGSIDQDGYLYLTDRRTDLIICGGINIWPAEVEAAILRHPAVNSCAVVGVPDSDLGQHVHAIVESNDGAIKLIDLCHFLEDHLARSKHPRSIELKVGSVRDDAGKFRKNANTNRKTKT